ncbi:SDR family NAD(P)-dependent oxidoreductase [Jiella mangrovi]|uniref:SDR family NAD(P)-dependent oxidoreductase n=1 Tax=Jiella mangrovi TaxID=2821407 RepID=A0ABS4BN08_9HYPH|nr:SDR family NAD(P)-dependent oxidoreductase [Jiella mangrovi]
MFVTGSTQGIGFNIARDLADEGHSVIVHARSSERAEETNFSGMAGFVVGDISTLAGMRAVADQANGFEPFDAVVHNAGLGYREPRRVETEDGLSQLWAVNVLAPYVLTCLIEIPKRLIFTGSGMHPSASSRLDDLQSRNRSWSGASAYAETKLQDIALAFALARRWPEVAVNAVSPGWVPTRMGEAGAPDDLERAHLTQVWLGASDETAATESGRYLYHKEPERTHAAARDTAYQDALIAACGEASGVSLPGL